MTISGIGQSMSMSSLYGMQRPSANGMAIKILKDLDTNGDGVLSTAEISKGGKFAQKLLEADSNGDGNVTMDELISNITEKMKNGNMQPPSASDMASRIMDKLDTNGDGVLSADEISKGGKHAQRILGADANGDGNVTMDELISDITEKMKNGNMQPPSASDMASSIMKALDTSGDGVLSTSDTSKSGANSKIIQAADANEDGKVTMEELFAYISKQYGEAQTILETTQSSSLSLVA